ncbi:hypothetical protein [Paractinoplanes maris]|uniref:hypothetical protein n=1 Tax=Paractinoplanes maris TaxID=1734446 RepID=UPI0020227676|nr:hypothetical protein [Actinoplanes maris]
MVAPPEPPVEPGLPTGDKHDSSPRPGLLGRAERLLGATAVLGAAIYALINVLYVEFYDDFGVRPEEVGWDRLTMLSRTAWVALAVLIVTVAFLLVRAVLGDRLQAVRPAAVAGHPIFAWFAIALLVLLAGYWYLTLKMEREADRVGRGETVNGIGLIVPFIDVRAYRAEVTWLGEAATMPSTLNSPHLTYLGRGRDTAVLVACGTTTVIVPADQVVISIKNRGHSRVDREAQQQEFARLCP